MRPRPSRLLALVPVVLLACGGSGADPTADTGGADRIAEVAPSPETSRDLPSDPDLDAGPHPEEVEGGPEATDTATEAPEIAPPPPCFDGLPPVPFDASATAAAYDGPVPDFTAETLDGPFRLATAWTGCDQYVIVLFNPVLADVEDFWSSPLDDLLDDSAPNAHYLFAVLERSDADRAWLVGWQQQRLEAELQERDAATRAAWAGRLHFVTSDAAELAPVAAALAVTPWEAHLTIDRHQRLREGHNASIVVGGGWKNRLSQVRYWAKYWNAEARRDAELAAEEASGAVVVHRLAERQDVTGQGWLEGHPRPEPVTWTLPDAASLASFGRLEIDLRVGCPGAGHPYAVACGEWDTIGGLYLCGDEACTPALRRRIVKWITPYSAPGRWRLDISPELVSLGAGGPQRFVTIGGDWDVGPYTYTYTVDLRLSKRGDGLRPFALEHLVPEGSYGWDAALHEAWGPFTFTPPAGTKRVELYALISGHGMAEGTNCAEFCTFTHELAVNGLPFTHTYVMEPSVNRCAARVEEGVVPNQGGTWFYDRSSWCPGWITEEWRDDLTPAVDLAGPNTATWSSGLGEALGTYGGGSMDARLDLVYLR